MAITYSYPGVYIQEFEPAPPIQGVGTSTAAFLGVARNGPIMDPTLLFSWDEFKAKFDADAGYGPYYLWYGVKGFFENGGTVCYVVRVSNARRSWLDFTDGPGKKAFRVWAKEAGDAGNNIKVEVKHTSAVSLHAFSAKATVQAVDATKTRLTMTLLDDAVRFRQGDNVTIDKKGGRSTVRSVLGADVVLDIQLEAAPNDVLRLADLSNAQHDAVIRFQLDPGSDALNLTPGAVLTINFGGGVVETGVVKSVSEERFTQGNSLTKTYRVTFRSLLSDHLMPDPATVTAKSVEFELIVTPPAPPAAGAGAPTPAAPPPETITNLSMDPSSSRFYVSQINNTSKWVVAEAPVPPSPTQPPDNIPAEHSGQLDHGKDEDLTAVGATDFQQGLDTLAPHKDVNMIVIPGADRATQILARDHCEELYNRIAILDSQLGLGISDLIAQEGALVSAKGFAALYCPWIQVLAPTPPPGPVANTGGPTTLLVPPSGHVAGVYARIAMSRGVHKAPAGEEAGVRGAVSVERAISDSEQGLLNLSGVNAIRVFRPQGRPVVWGTRTTATGVDSNWQYVNIRRLFLFLEGSIAEGIRSSVFEPNNPTLWQRLKGAISDFLTTVWRDGALFGTTAKEAFYVDISERLNPANELALGRLTIEIGVRPSYPAEFIIVRIGIWQGGTQVAEQ